MTLDTGTVLDHALDSILRWEIDHLMESRPVVRDGHGLKRIHHYRVALRRLRVVLELIRLVAPSSKLEEFRRDAKWLMSCLNGARDWDVFTTQTLPAILKACPSIDGDALGRAAKERRRQEHGKARATIDDPRAKRFLTALNRWVEQKRWRDKVPIKGLGLLSGSVDDFALKVLDDFHRKALKRGRSFRKLSSKGQHRLRIALKKLRHATHLFLPLLKKTRAREKYLKALSRLQDRLGRSHDLSVMEELVRQFRNSKMSVACRAAGALLGWRAAHRKRDDADLVKLWRKFRKVDRPCWQ